MNRPTPPSRREFLMTGSAAALAGSALAGSALAGSALAGSALAGDALTRLAPSVFVPGDDTIKIGMIGCGGRGSGAAVQALRADPNTRLVALGDAFRDRVERATESLLQTEVAARVEVPPERQFAGLDAWEQVLASDIDVVILASPPHFRPRHLRAAIERGLHVFAEKPVAVDAPGVRAVRAACELARKKKLSVVSGLCYRYHHGRRAILREIHAGRIGEIRTMEANYITGELWHHPRQAGWSEMEYQLRNWLYFTWLSGDLIAEQHIHSLDVMAWAMQDVYPIAAVSMGGRQKRTDPAFGNVYDHFATRYEFPGGVMGYSYCRQQNGCFRDVSDHIRGTKGHADVFKHRITGESPWQFEGDAGNMYQNEHDELFAAIRAGRPIDNGEYMCNSTLMAILGRMAAYTGERITWEQALNSEEDLTPKAYEWGDLQVAPVAVPGITRFS